MEIPPDMIITVQDVRDAGFCVDGQRRWFAANNLNFRDFLKNGMAATRFAEVDALSAGVVARKIALENPDG